MNKKLIELLGLKPDATEDQIIEAVNALGRELGGLRVTATQITQELGLDREAGMLEALQKIRSLKSGAATPSEREKRIAKLMSSGGHSRSTAEEIIAQQDTYDHEEPKIPTPKKKK